MGGLNATSEERQASSHLVSCDIRIPCHKLHITRGFTIHTVDAANVSSHDKCAAFNTVALPMARKFERDTESGPPICRIMIKTEK
jgi:hypothetical protein